MKSFPESGATEIHLNDAASAAEPVESESKPVPNISATSLAESLLAAEKQTLEKMANGASLSEVLNDLCAGIDAHGSPVTSMVCLLDGEWLSPCAGPHIPATFKAASHLGGSAQIGILRRRRVQQTTGDRSEYFQRSPMAG
jgi:hypothetical protein